MNRTQYAKRYILFLIGLFVNAVGVAFVTKANLGTSPNACLPYVMSLKFTPTIGQFSVLFNLILIGLQILIGREKYPRIQLLQIPVSILFGFFIDFCMEYIFFWMNPQSYGLKLTYLIIGCVILGISVFIEFTANVLLLPGEGLTAAIHDKCRKEKGMIKTLIDVSMCLAAIILSLALFHHLDGVREGTIVAAVMVGPVSKICDRIFGTVLKGWISKTSSVPAPAGKEVADF